MSEQLPQSADEFWKPLGKEGIVEQPHESEASSSDYTEQSTSVPPQYTKPKKWGWSKDDQFPHDWAQG